MREWKRIAIETDEKLGNEEPTCPLPHPEFLLKIGVSSRNVMIDGRTEGNGAF
jgi:hypothetical protein